MRNTTMSIVRDRLTDTVHFSGTVDMRDVHKLNLNSIDRHVVQSCGLGTVSADWLLALEVIFRRLQEAAEEKAKELAPH